VLIRILAEVHPTREAFLFKKFILVRFQTNGSPSEIRIVPV
jgi:hypothetical protein